MGTQAAVASVSYSSVYVSIAAPYQVANWFSDKVPTIVLGFWQIVAVSASKLVCWQLGPVSMPCGMTPANAQASTRTTCCNACRTTMSELGDLLTEEEICAFIAIMDVDNDGVIGVSH